MTAAPRGSSTVAEVFERVVVFWVEGTELPPAAPEDKIDRAALCGDVQTLAAALAAYERGVLTDPACGTRPSAREASV
jgi:hypothetical protein